MPEAKDNLRELAAKPDTVDILSVAEAGILREAAGETRQ